MLRAFLQIQEPAIKLYRYPAYHVANLDVVKDGDVLIVLVGEEGSRDLQMSFDVKEFRAESLF